MYCSEACLVNYGAGKVRAITLYCNSWKCDICLPRRKSQLVREACEGLPQRLLTLTTRYDPNGDPVAEARRQGKAFAALMLRLRRSFPNAEVEYFVVREATKKGWPHLHVLLRCPYVHWRQWRRWWLDASGSPGVDIRKIWKPAAAAKYVAKYIGKDPHQFGTAKRYWCSKGWHLEDGEAPERDRSWDHKWWIVATTISELRETYWLRRWTPVLTGRNNYMEAFKPP